MRRPITAEEKSSELRNRVDWKRVETLAQHLPVHVDSLDKVTLMLHLLTHTVLSENADTIDRALKPGKTVRQWEIYRQRGPIKSLEPPKVDNSA